MVLVYKKRPEGHLTGYFAAELNIPYYPLLRRNVDCIIALDASADYQVCLNERIQSGRADDFNALLGFMVHSR